MATIEIDVSAAGQSLDGVAEKLAAMTNVKVQRLFAKYLKKSAVNYPRYVRQSVYSIPTHGAKHTGLRARIALCATLSSGTESRGAWVSVWIDPGKMRPDYLTLPLYMNGTKAPWRHPVYGDRRKWVAQAPHPYFDKAVASLGAQAEAGINFALEEITADLQ